MYHRVLDEHEVSDAIHPGMFVTTQDFRKHLEYLSRSYQVVSFDQFFEWMMGKADFCKTPCVISFDDGWEDNYRNAFPLLKSFHCSAHIFLITRKIGTEGFLTWDQIREMEGGAIRFGSHTATHTVLTSIDEERALWELVSSRATIEGQLSRPCPWFCYPKGEHNRVTYGFVRQHYSATLTTDHGVVSRGDDPFTIRRIGIHHDIAWTTSLFVCRLATLL